MEFLSHYLRSQNISLKLIPECIFWRQNILEEIPMDQFYNITDLIQDMLNKQRKVGVFPINQGSWTDIGNWDDYLNIVKPRSSSC